MENLKKYTVVTEDDSSDNMESDVEKNIQSSSKTIKKRKTPAKKIKPVKIKSYMDKIQKFIENEDVSLMDKSINLMFVKQDDHNYTFKYPVNNGNDYWVLQHYKMKDIKEISAEERWKHSNCSIKIYTSNENPKDANIINEFTNLIETLTGRFISDPDKKVTKRKNDKT